MKLDMQRVEIAMGDAGLNFSTLALISGVSRTTLSYVRNGKSCKPDVCGKIAKALSVPLVEIIETTSKLRDELGTKRSYLL